MDRFGSDTVRGMSSRFGGANVSVVMSVYNDAPHWVSQSIESVLNQSFSDFEYLIVLNNPEAKQLREMIRSYAQQDQRIKMLDNPKHLSLAASLNAALGNVSGRFIARMDADDICDSRRLSEQVRFLEKNKEVSLVGTNALLIDEDDQEIGRLRKPQSSRSVALYHRLGVGSCVLHPTWCARAELFHELSGYRVIITHAEDYDFLLRGAARGHRYANLSEPLLRYRIRKGFSIEGFHKQFNLARLLRRQYLNKTILDDEVVQSSIAQLPPADTRIEEDCSKAIMLLYEAKRDKVEGRASSFLQKLFSAFRLCPAIMFDIAVRNSLANKLLS